MQCIEHLIGPEAYFGALALAVGVLVNLVKRRISSDAVPLIAFAIGYVIDALVGYLSCGFTLSQALLSGLGGGLAGLTAAGGHEALMRAAKRFGFEGAATVVLGKAKREQAKRKGKKATAALLVLCVLPLSGCAGVLPALAKAAQGAQWLGSIVEVADAGASAYFARHPSLEREQRVNAAVKRARLALAALDAALATADAAANEDAARAKQEALAAYADLRALLVEFGVLSATPPAGGAEADAPEPEPFALPMPAEVSETL